jgi:F420-non-reducing hydrogenase iron-sulfur subunit
MTTTVTTEPATTAESRFEPVIIGFTCNWCSYRAADLAGTARVKYAPNVRLIRLMCSGRLDPTFVLRALSDGADAVMITGCHPGECHYIEQNLNALRRFLLLRRTLEQFGIEKGRVKLVWASAAEGVRLGHEIDTFVEEVRALGPLDWPTSRLEGPEAIGSLGIPPEEIVPEGATIPVAPVASEAAAPKLAEVTA